MLVSELESTISAQALRIRGLEERLERVERRQRPRSPSRDERCTVYLTRTTPTHTRDWLSKMAQDFGQVQSIFVPTRESAGWASIRFSDPDGADACVRAKIDLHRRHGFWVSLYDNRRSKRR